MKSQRVLRLPLPPITAAYRRPVLLLMARRICVHSSLNPLSTVPQSTNLSLLNTNSHYIVALVAAKSASLVVVSHGTSVSYPCLLCATRIKMFLAYNIVKGKACAVHKKIAALSKKSVLSAQNHLTLFDTTRLRQCTHQGLDHDIVMLRLFLPRKMAVIV